MEQLSEARFTAGDVCRCAGINTATLQQWCARGIVGFELVKQGDRQYRRFDFFAAVYVTALEHLRKVGILPSASESFLESVKSQIGQRLLLADWYDELRKGRPRAFGLYTDVGSMFCTGDEPLQNLHQVAVSTLVPPLPDDMPEDFRKKATEHRKKFAKAFVVLDLDQLIEDVSLGLSFDLNGGSRRDDVEQVG